MESLMGRLARRARRGFSRGRPNMFKALCDSDLVGFAVCSEDGRFVESNAELRRMLGYSGEELAGMTYHDISHPEDIAECDRRMAELRAGEVERFQFEKRFVRKDGGVIWCQMMVASARERGRPRRFAAILVDRTAEKESEEDIRSLNKALAQRAERRSGQLAVNRATLLAVLDASLDGILAVNPEGRFLFHNRRFADMWGLPEEILRRGDDDEAIAHVLALVVDPEGFKRRIRHLYDHPDETGFERVALRDGRVFERFSSAIRTTDGRLHGRVWYFRDVTGRDSV